MCSCLICVYVGAATHCLVVSNRGYPTQLPPLHSGVHSQNADATVKVWSVILPQLLPLTVHLQVVSTTLETNTRLKGWYGLEGPSRKRFRVRGWILAPPISIGIVSGCLVAAITHIYLHYLHTHLGFSYT
jgi:hypothetical protein